MKAALIGYGYWGKVLQRYLDQEKTLNLVWIYDPKLPCEGRFTNQLSELEKDSEIQAVFLAAPVQYHWELSKRMLLSGKHVFCEKPAVKTMEEWRELQNLTEDCKQVFFTDYLYTCSPGIQFIKEHLQEIGELYNITGNIEQFGNFYKDQTVYEIIGLHLVSAIFYLVGVEMSEVAFKTLVNFKQSNCFYGQADFTLKNKIKVVLLCNLIGQKKVRTLQFYGEKGSIFYDMNDEFPVTLIQYKKVGDQVEKGEEKKYSFDEKNTVALAIQKFLEDIRFKNYRSNIELSKQIQQWLSLQ